MADAASREVVTRELPWLVAIALGLLWWCLGRHLLSVLVVVADILMPEKDGLEVIMYLQRESPLTKCVAMSSPSNRVFLQSAQLLGATRVVEKPFTPADIEAAVRDALG